MFGLPVTKREYYPFYRIDWLEAITKGWIKHIAPASTSAMSLEALIL